MGDQDIKDCEIGMVGLGTMGANLVLNMAEHGFAVAGCDRSLDQVEGLRRAAGSWPVFATTSPQEMVRALRRPRAVMFLVPAGKIVDSAIAELLPLLEPGDLLLDGGNSHFTDTNRRCDELAKRGFGFLGVGVSGGSSGARRGPSIMPGGPPAAYERVRPILEAVAAKVGGEPCVAYLGPRSAGHYVKMVHNGIEYAMMQLIAESYDLLKRGLGFSNDQLHATFDRWNRGDLQGFLVEITAAIFLEPDDRQPAGQLPRRLVDMILDQAEQKGTGAWTSESAMAVGVPIPLIDVAVSMRCLSDLKEQRLALAEVLPGPPAVYDGNRDELVGRLAGALYAGLLVTYAQGLTLLGRASRNLGYGFRLDEVARIWRGGCIIRSALLDPIGEAFRRRPELPTLLLDEQLAGQLAARLPDLRAVVATMAQLGLPAPGLMTALGYVDSYRSGWLPANLIQAQRDCFGSHTYRRTDLPGVFHHPWMPE